MGLKKCEIFFDNPWNTYYAGQTVNGRVDYEFDSPKKIRGILIQFKGEANTSWSQTESRTTNEGKTEDETTNLTGHEEYFKIQYYLLGGKTGEEIELPAGKHSYPFTCALPPTLPSSFEGEFGHVRYTVKVTLDRPWKFDQETKVAFTIVSAVDLNLNARVKEPVKQEVQKTFCCFCCESGPLTLVVSLPCTGYVSGQIVPVTLECDNASDVNINSIKFILQKVVTFYSQTPARESKKLEYSIVELTAGPLEGRKNETFKRDILIPPLPPSNLSNCGIIDLDYEIKIQAVVSGWHSGVTINIPISLGTIPLATPPADIINSSDANSQALGWNAAISGGDDQMPPSPPHHSMYPTIPLPSFGQSEFKSATIQDKTDNEYTNFVSTNFAPMYPVYNYAPSAPQL